MAIPPDTSIGPVSLTIRDLDRMQDFYGGVLGLRTLERDGSRATFGVEDGRPLVDLVRDAKAPDRPPGTTGLFHLAVLVPTRCNLAEALRRLADAHWPLAGASDHLVSEALYLDDPEGNGIEIYRDRPREQWRHEGDEIAMATHPLDLQSLIGGLDGKAADKLPGGTRIGHVHLNVANLEAAEAFYAGLLGFDVTARGYPGALFVSAGGYHHHIGLNTWTGEGASPPAAASVGLRAFEVVLPNRKELEQLTDRLQGAGAEVGLQDGTATLRDPSENRVVLTTWA